MFWIDHDLSGWGWFGMSLSMIVFWGLIIAAAVLLFRTVNRPPEHTGASTAPPASPVSGTPEQLLAERFARGEIDEEEYRRRFEVLRSGGPRLTKQ
ncbi:SHOCT domain-containing protein [Streptomyces sp. NPDC001617]